MTTIEIIVGLVAVLALYVAVKAHLHHATLAAEVKNQAGKVDAVAASVDAKVQTAVTAAVADIKSKV